MIAAILCAAFIHPNHATVARKVLDLMNSERREYGLPRLHMNRLLIESAHRHNETMGRDDRMAHRLPGEAPFGVRIERTGYWYVYAGENVGYNSYTSLKDTLYLERKMFNEKPPEDTHRQNILASRYTAVGIDVYYADHKVWLTEDFGSPNVR